MDNRCICKKYESLENSLNICKKKAKNNMVFKVFSPVVTLTCLMHCFSFNFADITLLISAKVEGSKYHFPKGGSDL